MSIIGYQIPVVTVDSDGSKSLQFLDPGVQLSALTMAPTGPPAMTNVGGSSSGFIPQNPIPLACMAINMVLPLQTDGTNISIAAATESAAGSMSSTDKTRLDNLASVAISGAYNDLSGRPTLGTASAQNTSAFATSAQGTLAASALQPGAGIPWSTVTSTPTSLSGYGIIDGVSVNGSYANPSWVTSFAYSKLTGAPSLATVATTGSYTDLTGVVASSAVVAGTMSSSDFSKLAAFPAYAARSFSNAVTLTIQTVAAAGNGSQVSTTRDAAVSYSSSVTTTSTIGGPQAGTIVLEICSTNSSTAANWQEISRVTNSQTITLAIALQSIQINAAALAGMVPAGFFRRLRSIITSGTPAFSYNSGQEVLL